MTECGMQNIIGDDDVISDFEVGIEIDRSRRKMMMMMMMMEIRRAIMWAFFTSDSTVLNRFIFY